MTTTPAALIRSARERAGLSQRELAERAGTSQPAIARTEKGGAGITIDTLRRLLEAAGFDLVITAEPAPAEDPLTAAYRKDVDRTLLRQSLRRSVDERLRIGAETVADLEELERATRSAGRKPGRGR